MSSDESLSEPFSASESDYEPEETDSSSEGKKKVFVNYKNKHNLNFILGENQEVEPRVLKNKDVQGYQDIQEDQNVH